MIFGFNIFNIEVGEQSVRIGIGELAIRNRHGALAALEVSATPIGIHCSGDLLWLSMVLFEHE